MIPWRRIWRWQSSGILHHIVFWKLTDVSELLSVSSHIAPIMEVVSTSTLSASFPETTRIPEDSSSCMHWATKYIFGGMPFSHQTLQSFWVAGIMYRTCNYSGNLECHDVSWLCILLQGAPNRLILTQSPMCMTHWLTDWLVHLTTLSVSHIRPM
jgi:hypothetical protein